MTGNTTYQYCTVLYCTVCTSSCVNIMRHDNDDVTGGEYSFWVGVCFTLNYIIGRCATKYLLND